MSWGQRPPAHDPRQHAYSELFSRSDVGSNNGSMNMMGAEGDGGSYGKQRPGPPQHAFDGVSSATASPYYSGMQDESFHHILMHPQHHNHAPPNYGFAGPPLPPGAAAPRRSTGAATIHSNRPTNHNTLHQKDATSSHSLAYPSHLPSRSTLPYQSNGIDSTPAGFVQPPAHRLNPQHQPQPQPQPPPQQQYYPQNHETMNGSYRVAAHMGVQDQSDNVHRVDHAPTPAQYSSEYYPTNTSPYPNSSGSIRGNSYSGSIISSGSGPVSASTSSYEYSNMRWAPAASPGMTLSESSAPDRPFHQRITSPPLGQVSDLQTTYADFHRDGTGGTNGTRPGSIRSNAEDVPAWIAAGENIVDGNRVNAYYTGGRRSPASSIGSPQAVEDGNTFNPQAAFTSNHSLHDPSLYASVTQPSPRRSSVDSDRISLYYGNASESRLKGAASYQSNHSNPYHYGSNGASGHLNPRRSIESMRSATAQLRLEPLSQDQHSFSTEDRATTRFTEASTSSTRPSSVISNQSGQELPPRKLPVVYPALLSRVAEAFKSRIALNERVKDGLVYPATFDGRDAVDQIAHIIRTSDRNLALLLGRALDAQKLFHDVTYDHRLRDSSLELYQFRERLALPFMTSNEMSVLDHCRSPIMRPGSIAETTLSSEESMPSGVFTLLTDCYSPTCTRDRLCYSIACPRRLEQQARLNLKIKPGLQRSVSSESLGDLREPGSLWIHSVSKETAESTSETEKKRQEALNEVFYTERDFVRDLEYLRDRWIKPLRTQNIIPEARREAFVTQVFWNVLEIHSVSVRLAELLNKRQKQAEVVNQVGDVFLDLVPHFGPFVKYGAHQLYGKYEFEKEKGSNPAFARFVDETERLPESRKLELNAYLTKPTTRLARYPLLLEACLKHTPEDNPDKVNLPKVVKLVREFLGKVNVESGKSENRFNLAQLDQQLVFKQGEAVDLRLRDEDREMIFKGPLKKRGGTQSDSAELQVFLFDHAILMVKQKIKNEQYKVYRKPIPLELLVVAPIDDSNSGRTVAVRPKSLMARGTATKYSAQPPPGVEKNSKQGFAMTFIHLGRRGYQITVWAASWAGRKKWLEKIEARQNELKDRSLVFETLPLTSGFFVGANRLICAAPFDNGNRMVYGTDNGVYLSDLRDRNKPPVKVISVPNVTQLDVLEEQGILIVLADKAVQTFFVDHLDPGDAIGAAKRARKISSHATFFKAGQCLGRTLVCVVKSGSVSSTIKTLEPIDQARNKKQPALRKFLQGSNESLRIFKEFYIPNESSSIHFLKSKLCVGCTKGFEIVDLESLDTQGLLDPADSSLDFVQKRDSARPIAIYRIDGEFLLCYDEFAFYVNKNGWRAKSNWIIQWEGFPTHFALHYPYVLAFEPTFIEVRHVESGALMQIIPGNNIRCLFAESPPSLSNNSAFYPSGQNAFGYGRYAAPMSLTRNEMIVADGDRAFSLQFTG